MIALVAVSCCALPALAGEQPPRISRGTTTASDGTWIYWDEHGQIVIGPHEQEIEQRSGDGFRLHISVHDNLQLAEDGTVLSLDPGAHAILETSWKGVEPRLVISSESGLPRFNWSVAASDHTFDDVQQQWMRTLLVAFGDLGEALRLRGEISRLHDELERFRGPEGRLRAEIERIRDEESELRAEIGRLRVELNTLRHLEGRSSEQSDQERALLEERRAEKKAAIRELKQRIAGIDVDHRVRKIEDKIARLGREGGPGDQVAEAEGRPAETPARSPEPVKDRSAEIEDRIEALEDRLASVEPKLERHVAELKRLTLLLK